MRIRALSLHQPWATLIASGKKTVETRRWHTSYRGPLLICAAKRPAVRGHLTGVALCIARLVECRKMTPADEQSACIAIYPGAWAWILEDVRRVEPFAVSGRQRLFDVDLAAPGLQFTDDGHAKQRGGSHSQL